MKRNIITDAIVHMKGDVIPEYKNAPTEEAKQEVAETLPLYY